MIELKNSKTTYLGKAPDGRNRYALDASIGAVQMKGEGEDWQDIKPRIVKTATGWRIDGAPYSLELSSDGGRRIFPNRQDRSKYIHLPAMAFFKTLPKRIEGNSIICSAPKFDVIFRFTNTGIQFQVLIKEPVTFDRITLDMDSAGLDILQLLKATSGLGIPRPRLIDSTTPFPQERWLDWSLKDGQLELGFDLTGLKFPVLLKNSTLEVSVAASADDCQRRLQTSSYFGLTDTYIAAGDYSTSYYDYSTGMRFLNITIPQGATIDNGTVLKLVAAYLENAIAATIIEGEDADTTLTFSTAADYDARIHTTASIPWTPAAWVTGTVYNSPELKTIIQEIVDRALWVSGNSMVLFWRDATGYGQALKKMSCFSWDDTTYAPPAIHIEYTAGGGAIVYGACAMAGVGATSLLGIRSFAVPWSNAVYAVMHDFDFTITPEVEAMKANIDTWLIGKELWTDAVNENSNEQTGHKCCGITRFVNQEDMDSFMAFIEGQAKSFSTASGTVSKHWCGHKIGKACETVETTTI